MIRRWWQKVRHAFAVGQTLPEPTAAQLQIIDRLCQTVDRRQLGPVFLGFLELTRPLGYVSAQALYFLEPFATAIFSRAEYRELTLILERRDAVDLVSRRFDLLESGNKSGNSLSSHQSEIISEDARSDSSTTING